MVVARSRIRAFCESRKECDPYRKAILKLNQEMEDVILVNDEKINDLESLINELKYENRDLRDRLYKLTKDKK